MYSDPAAIQHDGGRRWLTPPFPEDSASDAKSAEKMWIAGGTLFGANAAIMGYYFATFYSDRESARTKWHTFDDWYNADLNVDKFGHIWGTQVYAHTLYYIFKWAELNESQSLLWSSIVAWFFQFEMEMTDSFYKSWGFSWWDIGANTLGAALPSLSRIWEPLQSVTLKMSYHPSPGYFDGYIDYPLKDYDGFTYWLSLNIDDMLPDAAKPYWPDWLCIAAGYGAANTLKPGGGYNTDKRNIGLGDQEWYIALDYDLRKLPGDSDFIRFLKEGFNYFHLPAPAIRFSPSGIFYGIYF